MVSRLLPNITPSPNELPSPKQQMLFTYTGDKGGDEEREGGERGGGERGEEKGGGERGGRKEGLIIGERK